ncbi:hypothetical protein [Bradyrhizobium prioriisuperbiae]|uniref:hypothetical protein n=1 Tax=Bradyrhizobium prioriisuperbiae TaxID=2854389 RepID=UPI0028F171AF|nr:hypothetical protein [Bradyrhizobium prioritasuperba]
MRLHFFSLYPALAAIQAGLRSGGTHFLTRLSGGSVRQYRPEAHYMRGPGPKWRKKHGEDGPSSKYVQHLALLNDKWSL